MPRDASLSDRDRTIRPRTIRPGTIRPTDISPADNSPNGQFANRYCFYGKIYKFMAKKYNTLCADSADKFSYENKLGLV